MENKRWEEIKNAIHHGNDINLAHTIVKNISEIDTDTVFGKAAAVDLMKNFIVELRNLSVDRGTKGRS